MNVVFGAAGVVGSKVLEGLARRGRRTRAAFHSRIPSQHADERVRVELCTGEGLEIALSGAESVFLATGDMVDQAAAEVRVIETAARLGVKRVVKLSILCADSEAFFLARVHHEVEQELERSGLPYTVLRPGGFMQNFVNYYGPMLRADGVLRLPCGNGVENPIDVEDVARVATSCLSSDAFIGRTLNLLGPEALTYGAMVDSIATATRRSLRYESISEESFRAFMLPYSVTPEHVDGLIDMFRFHQEGRAPKQSHAVWEVTGVYPRSFDEFARENAASWRA